MINTNSGHTHRQDNYHQTVDKPLSLKFYGKTGIRLKVYNMIHTNSGHIHNEDNYDQTMDKPSSQQILL